MAFPVWLRPPSITALKQFISYLFEAMFSISSIFDGVRVQYVLRVLLRASERGDLFPSSILWSLSLSLLSVRSCKTKCVPWREYFHIAINADADTAETFPATIAVGQSALALSAKRESTSIRGWATCSWLWGCGTTI